MPPIRLLLLTACFTVAGCASQTRSQTQAEVSALQAEVRMLRETQQRTEARVRRLEGQAVVASALGSGSSSGTAGQAAPSKDGKGSTPDLTVVKLKPRREPAPKIHTEVPVTEPALEDLSALGGSPRVDEGDIDELPTTDNAFATLQYDEGLRALKTGNVEGGVEKLRKFAEENPQHPQADNALYFGGLGLMGLKDFKAAATAFEQLTVSYPAGDAVLDAMLKLAECQTRLNRKDDARSLYTKILLNYPGTAAATQAEQRLVALTR